MANAARNLRLVDMTAPADGPSIVRNKRIRVLLAEHEEATRRTRAIEAELALLGREWAAARGEFGTPRIERLRLEVGK